MDDACQRVRIDKWLWAARFYKTRSLASDAVQCGQVRVSGERIKPSREVRVGERVWIDRGEGRIEVLVMKLATVRGPASLAQALYQESAESITARLARAEARRFAPEPAEGRQGRPTKRDRRALDRVSGHED